MWRMSVCCDNFFLDIILSLLISVSVADDYTRFLFHLNGVCTSNSNIVIVDWFYSGRIFLPKKNEIYATDNVVKKSNKKNWEMMYESGKRNLTVKSVSWVWGYYDLIDSLLCKYYLAIIEKYSFRNFQFSSFSFFILLRDNH